MARTGVPGRELRPAFVARLRAGQPPTKSSPSCRRRSKSSRRRRSPIARRHRAHHHRPLLRGPGLGLLRHDRYRRYGGGQDRPSGRTKVIQPFETGVVRAIHVRDGQSVKAGDVLIELDPTINEAESKHLRGRSRRRGTRCRAAYGRAERGCRSARRLSSAAGRDAAHGCDAAAIPGSSARRASRQARRARSAESAKGSRTRDRRRDGRKLEAMLPVLQQRVDIRKSLLSHETGSKANYLELLQALVETQQELLGPEEPFHRGGGGDRRHHGITRRRPTPNSAAPSPANWSKRSARRPDCARI